MQRFTSDALFVILYAMTVVVNGLSGGRVKPHSLGCSHQFEFPSVARKRAFRVIEYFSTLTHGA